MNDLRYFEAAYETMSRHDLAELQWAELKHLVERAQELPFYARKFKGAKFSPSKLRSLDDVGLIPVTTKDEICEDIRAHQPFGSRLAVPPDRIVSVVETSGTSGKGKEVHVAAERDLERITRMEASGLHWAGISSGAVVAFTIPITMTAASTWWFLALNELRANCLRLGHLSTEDKLGYMKRYRVNALLVTPSYLTRLEHCAREMGINLHRDLASMTSIIVAGESRSAHWARERQRIWGATVYEQWGCTQGAVAWSCEEGVLRGEGVGLLHWLPHLALMEVVDPETGSHVGDGEFGELIITPLGVEAAPLIRFATGDRVRFRRSEFCTCGRSFDGIESGSISRYDDMMKVKGVNLWPATVASLVERHQEIVEHRVTAAIEAAGIERVTLEVEFDKRSAPDRRQALIEQLRQELRASSGISFDVVSWEEPVSLASAILGESWKGKRWLDLREAGRQS